MTIRPLLAGRRVLVVGDVMLDRYVHGRVDRLSPEAPVPVFVHRHSSQELGGAANVARTIAALGGVPRIVAAVGDDAEGQLLAALVRQVDAGAVLLGAECTTVKTRYVDQHGTQLFRIDQDSSGPRWFGTLIEAVKPLLADADAICLSDYHKGLLGSVRAGDLSGSYSGEFDIPVVVNAKHGYDRFYGATLIVLNRGELAAWCADRRVAPQLEAAAQALRETTAARNVLVTLGDAGMLLVRDAGPLRIEAHRREVADVTGAGDVVTAVCALCLAAKLPVETAAALANLAAGASVARRGTGYATLEDLEPRDTVPVYRVPAGGVDLEALRHAAPTTAIQPSEAAE
jgi:rfaE bifunctional protein kinase chain/domain